MQELSLTLFPAFTQSIIPDGEGRKCVAEFAVTRVLCEPDSTVVRIHCSDTKIILGAQCELFAAGMLCSFLMLSWISKAADDNFNN